MKENNRISHVLWGLMLMLSPQISVAATFCVTTSNALVSALDVADDNNESDVIRIAKGTYISPGFLYRGDGDYDLVIIGGWIGAFGSSCGFRFSSVSPFDTVIDGNNTNRGIKIFLTDSANLTVTSLYFVNGDTLENGGGINVRTDFGSYTGDILIERNAFINNSATQGSALHISNKSYLTIVRNNLFVANTAQSLATIVLRQSNPGKGIYFTNNTVMNNENTVSSSSAGLNISLYENTKALVANNLLWNNQTPNGDADFQGGGIDRDIYMYNNDIGVMVDTVIFEESGNISLLPMLNAFNFIPQATSPLVNAGTEPPQFQQKPPLFYEYWILGALDIGGDTRLQGNHVDIGAYEFEIPILIFEDSFE